MPIGEIAGEFLIGSLRFIGSIIAEVILELLVKGPGYLICKPFRKDIDPDSAWVVFVGLVFWVLVATGGYFTYTHISEAIAVDKCLYAGGAFDYQTQQCVCK